MSTWHSQSFWHSDAAKEFSRVCETLFPSHFYRVFNLFKLDLCWQWIPLFLILMSFRHHSPVPNSSWWFQANLLRTRFIKFIFPFLNTDHWVICVELAEITRCIFASEKHAGGAKWRGGTSMRRNECGFIGSLPQSVDSQSYAWLCRWSSPTIPTVYFRVLGVGEIFWLTFITIIGRVQTPDTCWSKISKEYLGFSHILVAYHRTSDLFDVSSSCELQSLVAKFIGRIDPEHIYVMFWSSQILYVQETRDCAPCWSRFPPGVAKAQLQDTLESRFKDAMASPQAGPWKHIHIFPMCCIVNVGWKIYKIVCNSIYLVGGFQAIWKILWKPGCLWKEFEITTVISFACFPHFDARWSCRCRCRCWGTMKRSGLVTEELV